MLNNTERCGAECLITTLGKWKRYFDLLAKWSANFGIENTEPMLYIEEQNITITLEECCKNFGPIVWRAKL